MTIETLIKANIKTVIDVREPWEFNAGHLDNAINMPLSNIIAAPEKLENFPKPIIVYCRSGYRSGHAQSILKSSGIQQVYNGGSFYNLLHLM